MTVASATIDACRESLKRDGFGYLESLGEDFDYVHFLQYFGKLLRQYDGEVIWSIRPEQRFEDTYHSKNTKELQPHTECYEYPGLPPKYLALWCVDPGVEGEGFTHLADVSSFMLEQADETRGRLEQVPLRYFSTAGLQSEQLALEASHPMLSYGHDGAPVIRFSVHCMDYSDAPEFEPVVQAMRHFIDENKVSIAWKRHSLLIWDNHRMVHSRDAFSSTQRELKRVWLTA